MSILGKIFGYAGELSLDAFFLKVLPGIWGFLKKSHSELPQEMKTKVPKWFGLTLDDEQIFNGVLATLSMEQQIIIGRFLHEKCKDYERNRFINIVAGMEVSPGRAEEKETKWDKDGKKVYEKVKAGSKGVDRRQEFLESFAKRILDPNGYDKDLDKAYSDCVGGRMIIPDPIHQKILKTFSGSLNLFKKFVLAPFGAVDIKDLLQKVKQKMSKETSSFSGDCQSFREKAKAFYEGTKGVRK